MERPAAQVRCWPPRMIEWLHHALEWVYRDPDGYNLVSGPIPDPDDAGHTRHGLQALQLPRAGLVTFPVCSEQDPARALTE
jgi:hypothetical protein